MAKVTFSINVPGWTVDELRQAVHDLELVEVDADDAIAPEKVRAEHVLGCIWTGDVDVPFEVLDDRIEDD